MANPIRGKRRARRLALQALYQWLMTADELSEIEAQFRAINNMEKVDGDYFHHLFRGIPEKLAEIQQALTPLLDRDITEINPIELTILRLSSFELLYCPELPYRVVLDECVALAREFGSEEGYRYVNGVLNNLAKQVRVVEMSSGFQPKENG